MNSINPTLDAVMYELNLIADSKSDCETYGTQIETKVRELFQTTVGGEYVQDVEITNRFTLWEEQIEKYRERIEVKFYY